MIGLWWVLLSGAGAAEVPDLYQQSYEQEALGAWRSALAALEALPPAEKQGYLYALRRGWLLYLDGQLDAAIGAYDQAIAREPDAIEPLLGRTLPLLAARRWTEAEAACRQVLARDPKNATARGRQAWALYNLGRYAEAEPIYRALSAEWPSDVELRAGLGWTLLQLGKKDQARPLFEAVLRVAPKHASAAAGLAAAR